MSKRLKTTYLRTKNVGSLKIILNPHIHNLKIIARKLEKNEEQPTNHVMYMLKTVK